MEYTIVDVETTGLDPRRSRVIEIAALKIRGRNITDEIFHSLVNPEEEISSFTRYLTGITDKELRTAPVFGEVAGDFLKFFGSDTIFVAHNARFDRSFISYELKRSNFLDIDFNTLCTVKLARQVVPGLESYSLKNLIEYFNFNHKKNHRALDDVKITAKLLLTLLNIRDGN